MRMSFSQLKVKRNRMAKVCKKCKGYGFLHKPGEDDRFCLSCPRSKPAIMRKWKQGRSCVIDKGRGNAIKGVLIKSPFMSPSNNWMVVVATIEEAQNKEGILVPTRFNVMLIKKRVTLK